MDLLRCAWCELNENFSEPLFPHEHYHGQIPVTPCRSCSVARHDQCDPRAPWWCNCTCGLTDKEDNVAIAFMVDLSSNNGTSNLHAHYAAGYRVLALKVTEGTSYAWGASHALADEWHALGPDAIVWHYHFLHPGTVASGAAQADWFWAHVKADLRPGDRVVCDCETKGETGSEIAGFWARYMSHDPHTPRVDYGGPYFFRDNMIRPRHDEALWLADYDVRPAFIPPGWATWLAWQYTDRATHVPGIPGAVDHSHLTAAALPAKPAPPKPPRPAQEDDVARMLEDTRHTPHPVWMADGMERRWISSPAERDFWKAQGVPLVPVSAKDAPHIIDPLPVKAGTKVPA